MKAAGFGHCVRVQILSLYMWRKRNGHRSSVRSQYAAEAQHLVGFSNSQCCQKKNNPNSVNLPAGQFQRCHGRPAEAARSGSWPASSSWQPSGCRPAPQRYWHSGRHWTTRQTSRWFDRQHLKWKRYKDVKLLAGWIINLSANANPECRDSFKIIMIQPNGQSFKINQRPEELALGAKSQDEISGK